MFTTGLVCDRTIQRIPVSYFICCKSLTTYTSEIKIHYFATGGWQSITAQSCWPSYSWVRKSFYTLDMVIVLLRIILLVETNNALSLFTFMFCQFRCLTLNWTKSGYMTLLPITQVYQRKTWPSSGKFNNFIWCWNVSYFSITKQMRLLNSFLCFLSNSLGAIDKNKPDQIRLRLTVT